MFNLVSLGIVIAAALTSAEKWLSVPYVEQVRAGCGSAAVAMVVEYWAEQDPSLRKTAIDMETVDRLLPATRQGIDGKALGRFLKGAGFDVFIFDGELSDLRHHLAKGRPVIVCLAPRGLRAALHYAVVVGLDDETVMLNDSARGKLISEDVRKFAKEWDATGHWALLALPAASQ